MRCSVLQNTLRSMNYTHTCAGDATARVSRIAGTDEAVLCSHNISAGSERFMTVVPAQSTLIKVFKRN